MFRTAIARNVRLFSTTRVVNKSPVETVKDAAKKVDRVVSDAAVKGIETGEAVAGTVKQKMPHSEQEAKGQAQELASEAKGKAQELAGQAQGTAQQAKGKAQELAGEAQGSAQQAKGQVKGKANELAGEAKGKASELEGEAKARGY